MLSEQTKMKWGKKCQQLQENLQGFLSSKAYPLRPFRKESNEVLIRNWVYEGGNFSEAKLAALKKEVETYEKKNWFERLWARWRQGLGKKRSLLRVVEWARGFEALQRHLQATATLSLEAPSSVVSSAEGGSVSADESLSQEAALQAAISRLNERTKEIRKLSRWSRFRRKLPAELESDLVALQEELRTKKAPSAPLFVAAADGEENSSVAMLNTPFVLSPPAATSSEAPQSSQLPCSNQALLDEWVKDQVRFFKQTVLSDKREYPNLRARWEQQDRERLVSLWRIILSFFRYFLPARLQQATEESKALSKGATEKIDVTVLVHFLKKINKALSFHYHPDKNRDDHEATALFQEMKGLLDAVEELKQVLFGEKRLGDLSPQSKDLLVSVGILRSKNGISELESDEEVTDEQLLAWRQEQFACQLQELKEIKQSYIKIRALFARASQVASAVEARASAVEDKVSETSEELARLRGELVKTDATALAAERASSETRAMLAEINRKMDAFEEEYMSRPLEQLVAERVAKIKEQQAREEQERKVQERNQPRPPSP